jgi:hypothetical protein
VLALQAATTIGPSPVRYPLVEASAQADENAVAKRNGHQLELRPARGMVMRWPVGASSHKPTSEPGPGCCGGRRWMKCGRCNDCRQGGAPLHGDVFQMPDSAFLRSSSAKRCLLSVLAVTVCPASARKRPTYGTNRRHGVDGKCALSSTNDTGDPNRQAFRRSARGDLTRQGASLGSRTAMITAATVRSNPASACCSGMRST